MSNLWNFSEELFYRTSSDNSFCHVGKTIHFVVFFCIKFYLKFCPRQSNRIFLIIKNSSVHILKYLGVLFGICVCVCFFCFFFYFFIIFFFGGDFYPYIVFTKGYYNYTGKFKIVKCFTLFHEVLNLKIYSSKHKL